MDETKKAWDEVGEGFARLGRSISERHRQLGDERAERAADASGESEGRMADAVRRATDELDRAFAALGDTFRNDEAREQARDTGRKLSDALRITFSTFGEEVRRTFGDRQSPGSTSGSDEHLEPAPPPPPAPPGSDTPA